MQAMLSFTSDPYHPFDTSLTARLPDHLGQVWPLLLPAQQGGNRALRDLSLFRPAEAGCIRRHADKHL